MLLNLDNFLTFYLVSRIPVFRSWLQILPVDNLLDASLLNGDFWGYLFHVIVAWGLLGGFFFFVTEVILVWGVHNLVAVQGGYWGDHFFL
jgi:hypothetical protein